jgi:alkyl hydroperoxide reductase subunit F
MADTTRIENYTGFQMVGGRELTDKFLEHVKHFGMPIAQGRRIARVTRENGLFSAAQEDGQAFRGKTVVFATGRSYRRLGVPGEQELAGHGVSYCVICDAPFFAGKRVVVAGGANSAFTAARDLLKIAREITLVNIAPGWQADESLMKPVIARESVKLLDNHEITRIEGQGNVQTVLVRSRASGEEKTIEADGVFVEIGGTPNSEPVRGLADLNEAGELIVDCRAQSSVEGLFGAGDVTTVPYKQIIISAGDGSKAALSAHDYLTKRGHA